MKKFHSWSTTTFVFKLEDMNNEQMRKEIMAREKRGLGFKFAPIQGGGWLSNKDLLAIKKLYQVRWTATITNWKEKGCDGCMWKVTCPDKNNKLIVQYGQVLSDTIEELLKQVKE